MKKIIMALALALLLSLFAFNTLAAEETHPHQGDHCVCGGSAIGVKDHTCANIQWKPLPTGTTNFAKLADGNYYLTQDLTITGATSFSNKKLTICLNGYNIDTTAGAVFGYVKVGSVLNICDCSGTKDAQGNWTWSGTVTGNRTGDSRAYGGIFNLNANSVGNIYGGNYVGATGGNICCGGVFNVCNDSFADAGGTSNTDPSLYTKLSIYNGHFTGGTMTKYDNTIPAGGIINTWHSVSVGIYGGTFVGGTAPTKGNFSFNSYSKITLENCTITGGNPGAVLIMDSNGCVGIQNTLADALKKVTSGQYIRLTGDVNEAVTIPAGVCIDLGGNTLSGVTVDGAMFVDSATDSYREDRAGALIPAAGTPASYASVNKKHYLVAQENGEYSFHRYYAGITKITLKPGSVGMGYKATFIASDKVKAALSPDVAYGYRMWLSEDNKVTRGFRADRFGGTQELTLRIDNFLDTTLTAAENEQRANQKVYACPYIRLADGTYIEGATVSYTFREMLEKANTYYESYSQTQQTALNTLSATFSESMISWDIHNTHHAQGSCWTPMTSAMFVATLKANSNKLPSGNYVLTENVDIGARGIRIDAGVNVNLCLNGYTFKNSVRMFNNYGNLSFCDCHPAGQEGDVVSSFTSNPNDSDSEFTSIVYCYYDSVTNLYGGNLKSTGTLDFCGLIAVSHDGKDANATKPVGVFNMYGGTISGGNVTAGSGNIALWNGGIFNMYGGTIYGGQAKYAGNINVGTCTFNMYGGTVRDGIATEGDGGNIYGGGNINIQGGTVTGGISTTTAAYLCRGGNIYSTGTLNICNAAVTDGTASCGLGGNIYASGALHMENASVTGGEATALMVNDVAQLGTGLGSGIYATTNGNKTHCVTATGNVYIADNVGSDLYLGNLATLDATDLADTAKINLAAEARARISSDPASISHFSTNMEDMKIATINGGVALIHKDTDTQAVTQQGSTFRVGYSMADITSTEAGLTMSSYGNPSGRKTDGTVGYRMYATTVAITDAQNNTILMITIDLQNPPEALMSQIYQRINQVTGVPESNIYITATHTHNCPTISTSGAANLRYRALFVDMLVQGTMDAMADRAPATMQTGSFDTVGMNYSRHYYYYDDNGEKVYFGDQFGHKPTDRPFYRVRVGDTTMHMMAFERADKQPVLLVNWRAHPHRSGGKTKYDVTSDVIGATREYMHNNTDYLFAYYQGAAGNMNTTSRVSGETYKSGKIKEYGDELGRQIVTSGLPALTDAETGLIQTKRIVYAATVDHTQDDKYEQAVALRDYYNNNPVEMNVYENQIAKAAEFGFTSVFHATRLITKYGLPATKDMELNIFSIGDSIGFYTAPAELWDSFSEELEGESPFETTFCIGYCNGGVAYIPYKLDYYTSYEYFYCLFTQDDTINEMREYYLENLEEQHENAQ